MGPKSFMKQLLNFAHLPFTVPSFLRRPHKLDKIPPVDIVTFLENLNFTDICWEATHPRQEVDKLPTSTFLAVGLTRGLTKTDI